MSKSLSRTLYLIGLGVIIVGTILLLVSIFVGNTFQTGPDGATTGSIGSPVLFGISIFLMIAAAIPLLVSWIGALVKMAQLSRWGWFICLFFFHGITMLVYIFAGPETPPVSQVVGAPYGQPYPLQPQQSYGQQQYPEQQQYGQQQYQQYPQQQAYDQPQQSYGQYPEQPPQNRG